MQVDSTQPKETRSRKGQEQDTPDFTITPVRTQNDLTCIIQLFREYSSSLNLDLSFQSFEAELDGMPGRYAISERGELLIARNPAGRPLGCVALRCLSGASGWSPSTNAPYHHVSALGSQDPSQPMIGEIKRLYAVPDSRGMGVGRALATRIVEVARESGYDELRLDTLPSMAGAQRIYEQVGFVDVEPYCFNPVEGTRFLGLKLASYPA